MRAFWIWVTHSWCTYVMHAHKFFENCVPELSHLPPPLPMDTRPSSPSRASHHDCNIIHSKMTATTTPCSTRPGPRHHTWRNDSDCDTYAMQQWHPQQPHGATTTTVTLHVVQQRHPRHHTWHKDGDCGTTRGIMTATATPMRHNEAHLCLPPPALLGSRLRASQSPCFCKHSLSLLRCPHSSLPLPHDFPNYITR